MREYGPKHRPGRERVVAFVGPGHTTKKDW